MSAGVSLPHKDTIDSGSEQPERYYRPNPTPIILARERERARDTEREVELKMRSSQTAHTQGHHRGTELKGDGAGLQEVNVRGVQTR